MRTSPSLSIFVLFFFMALGGYWMWRHKKVTLRYILYPMGGWFVVVALIAIISNAYQSRILAPFEPHLADYLSLPGEKAGNPALQLSFANPAETPYIRGKVVVVQLWNKKLDQFYFWLPKELRAAAPDQVGSIVWLHCTGTTEKVVFAAGAKKETHNYICDVAVIDRSVSAIVAKQTFKKTAGEIGYEEALYQDIVDYLVSLPHK